MSLTEQEETRYARNLIIPEVGREGQERLLRSSALVVGAGGLGSPALYYLAAAGVGTLGLVDQDVVDLGNLQRQILHAEPDVGRPKVESASEKLLRLNPGLKLRTFPEAITPGNARHIIEGFDVVVDAVDNFEARYVMNDACIALGKPFVHGSVFRFEGQASVFHPPDGPCYRCLFPKPPVLLPGEDIGVIGPAPGVIGAIEAMEAIKVLLGIGRTLIGRLLIFNGLTMEFMEVNVDRTPDCPACGHRGETKG